MNEPASRVVAPDAVDADIDEASLRPQTLAEFIGQSGVRENLSVFIQAARSRNEALDHTIRLA